MRAPDVGFGVYFDGIAFETVGHTVRHSIAKATGNHRTAEQMGTRYPLVTCKIGQNRKK